MVGPKSYKNVEDMEETLTTVLPPQELDFKDYRRGKVPDLEGEDAEVDGVMFAEMDNGDCFVFDVSVKGSDLSGVLVSWHEENTMDICAALCRVHQAVRAKELSPHSDSSRMETIGQKKFSCPACGAAAEWNHGSQVHDYPNGIASSSPELPRLRGYPGKPFPNDRQPQRGCIHGEPNASTPLGLVNLSCELPRVARTSATLG